MDTNATELVPGANWVIFLHTKVIKKRKRKKRKEENYHTQNNRNVEMIHQTLINICPEIETYQSQA